LIASGSGSRHANSNCIRARHGLCTARTSIGPGITPTSVIAHAPRAGPAFPAAGCAGSYG